MCRGLKIPKHAMKFFEKVLDKRLRKVVMIDDMQLGFMPRKGTDDAVFIIRRQ